MNFFSLYMMFFSCFHGHFCSNNDEMHMNYQLVSSTNSLRNMHILKMKKKKTIFTSSSNSLHVHCVDATSTTALTIHVDNVDIVITFHFKKNTWLK